MPPDATTEKIRDKNKSRFDSSQAVRSNLFMSNVRATYIHLLDLPIPAVVGRWCAFFSVPVSVSNTWKIAMQSGLIALGSLRRTNFLLVNYKLLHDVMYWS